MNPLDLTDELPQPADLPDWARDAALNVVMAHDAEKIAAAIEHTGTNDPATLLHTLAGMDPQPVNC